MKRTLLFLVFAALAPVVAIAQVDTGPAPEPFKYEAYAGFAYSSLNQLDLSRYGLMGGRVGLTRNYGKYFGVRGSFDYFKLPAGTGSPGNPGNPSIYSFMVGPELHVDLFGPISGLLFGEIGAEHTGGEHMIPSTSFAGGFGGGMSYRLTNRLSIRATGDRAAASFSLANNTPQLAYSTHRSWNARATVGVVYRFSFPRLFSK